MARTLKKGEHTAKRNEILDAALQLIYTKGYGRMTIQDILEKLQISKGAFYHYFDSKSAVLEAMVERMVVEQMEPLLISTVQDPDLTALEKLQRYLDTAVRWKTAKKDLMIELARVWYSDENALARQKMYTMLVTHVTPLFDEIIGQGVREGTFTTPYPEYASQLSISMVQTLGDSFAEMLLAAGTEPAQALRRSEALVAAYGDALERILGTPPGSIRLMDAEALREWFSPENDPNLRSSTSQDKSELPRYS
ncbi:MAG TPA: TetR/AcrR family transcriptional regulator [Anaerolineales bacterium]